MRRLFLIIAVLSSLTLLSGCESTTAGGATGASRSQLLLISSDELNTVAAKTYQQEMSKARSARTLNTNATETRRVNAITQRLIPQVAVFRPDALEWQWEINVINENTINAYAMPGGKMVIYTGIIQQLKLSDEEIAAIIGHEMAHALREHSREQISQQIAKTQAISIAGTLLGVGGAGQTLATMAGNLILTLPFSRAMEIEADNMGMELMARAGYNPEGAVSVWQKIRALGDGSNPPQFLSTHPSDATRVANLQSELPKVMPLYQEARQKTAPAATGTRSRARAR